MRRSSLALIGILAACSVLLVTCGETDSCVSYSLQTGSSEPSPAIAQVDSVELVGPSGIQYRALQFRRARPDIVLCFFDPTKQTIDVPMYAEYFRYLGYDSFMLLNSSACVDSTTLPTIVDHLASIGYNRSRMLVFTEGASFRLPLLDVGTIKLRGAMVVAANYTPSFMDGADVRDHLSVGSEFPVLIAHGDHDQNVPVRKSFDLYERLGSKSPKRLVVLNAIAHNDVFYSDDFGKAVIDMFPSQSGLSDTLPRVKW